ncbi:MAG: hypothetical protein ABI430_00885 [Candidatus Taylorbacteria bacterium]
MRYIEIILKIVFLLLAITLWFSKLLQPTWIYLFIAVSFLLGITLLFNKKASYDYPQTLRDYSLRRIEGIILVISSISFGILKIKGLL